MLDALEHDNTFYYYLEAIIEFLYDSLNLLDPFDLFRHVTKVTALEGRGWDSLRRTLHTPHYRVFGPRVYDTDVLPHPTYPQSHRKTFP